jgi:serine/threonine protein phosphatase PrpC
MDSSRAEGDEIMSVPATAVDTFVSAIEAGLGEMDPRERTAVQAELRGIAASVFAVDRLPGAAAGNLAPPLTPGTPLVEWSRAAVEGGDLSEQALAPLYAVAEIVDALALSQRPLVGCPAAIWRVDAIGRLCPPGPRLSVWRADSTIGRLTEYQQSAGSGRVHRGLQRGFDGIDLRAASFHAFAVLLVEVLLGRTAVTTAELLDLLRKMPSDTAPSNLVDLLVEAVEASLREPPTTTCRGLLSRALDCLQTSVFRLGTRVNMNAAHDAFGYSVQGLHKPGGNEDRWGAWRSGPASLLLVADGVSTADLGTGSIAAEEIHQLVGHSEHGLPAFEEAVARCVTDSRAWSRHAEAFLGNLLLRAHARVLKRTILLAKDRPRGSPPARHPMSSTATVAFILGDQAVIGWVGDSPAWVHSPARGIFVRVTTAQNVGREQEFSFSSRRSDAALTQTIGACDYSREDCKYVAARIRPEFVTVQLAPGDLLLLGSDGLVDGIGAGSGQENETRFAAEVRRVAGQKKALNRLARNLIDPAENGSSHDNITVVVLRVHSGEEDHGRRDHSRDRAEP